MAPPRIAHEAREAAKAAGLPRFDAGVPCINGHSAPRLVRDGACTECVRQRNLRIYAADPEACRKRARDYLKDNPGKRLAYYRERRLANLEQVLEREKRYREANREVCQERNRKWREANPASMRAHERNRKARKRNAEGTHTSADLRRIWSAQRGKCAMCAASLQKAQAHLDHIHPLSKGGSNWPANLQYLCAPCNLSKKDKHPLVFARQRGLLL